MAEMNERTLTALKGSIAKWEAIVAGTGEDKCSNNCPLCQMCGRDCIGCPVMDKTGREGCANTPWEKWDAEFGFYSDKRMADTPERKRLAQAELDFLRSLLPVEASTPTKGDGQ